MATPRAKIDVPAASLDEYVGVYRLAKDARFTVVRSAGGLVVRLTGQPFFPVFPSARDEFFYEVVDAQLRFRRDASGRVVGLTLRQNGADLAAERSSDTVAHVEFPEAAALAELAGTYDFGAFVPGSTLEVRAAGSVLTAQLTGQPALPVFATGKDRFEYDVVEAALVFERDAAGKVVAVTLHQNGAVMRMPRK